MKDGDLSERAAVNRMPVHEPYIQVGQWYTIEGRNWKKERYEWFGCVVHVGSNYVELRGPADENSWHEARIHFDEFHSRCKEVKDPEKVIMERIELHRGNVAKLMEKASRLAAMLGIGPSPQLASGTETEALAVRSDEPLKSYKRSLVRAEKKTLPEIFKKIREEHEELAAWMKAGLLPMEAQADALKELTGEIKGRIFSVELYAGLVEHGKEIRGGKPAKVAEPVTIMQRMAFCDEECLARYETGGMDIDDLKAFDRWLARPENMERLLPFPRTVVAFRVRRKEKERRIQGIQELLGMLFAGPSGDDFTFLYIRNGEQLHRIRTGIEFDEKLFPDMGADKLAGELWVKTWGTIDEDDIIPEGEYRELVRQWKEYEKRAEEELKKPESERMHVWSPSDRLSEFEHFGPESVHYDDVIKCVKKMVEKHNRLVLILQGILDRSPTLHPHPPWKLWTEDGFAQAIRLVYDDTRALVPGPEPDFEAYRAKLNASIRAGSVTVGQQDAWEREMAEKENKRIRYRMGDRAFSYDHYEPPGNPGPGLIAEVVRATKTHVTFRWMRERRSWDYWERKKGPIPAAFTVERSKVLNVDAYTPGDFRQFFDDPRTRAEYLQWAPLLIAAEECKAGNVKVGGRLGKEPGGSADSKANDSEE